MKPTDRVCRCGRAMRYELRVPGGSGPGRFFNFYSCSCGHVECVPHDEGADPIRIDGLRRGFACASSARRCVQQSHRSRRQALSQLRRPVDALISRLALRHTALRTSTRPSPINCAAAARMSSGIEVASDREQMLERLQLPSLCSVEGIELWW